MSINGKKKEEEEEGEGEQVTKIGVRLKKILSNIVKIIRRNRYCPLEYSSPFLGIDNPETQIIFALSLN